MKKLSEQTAARLMKMNEDFSKLNEREQMERVRSVFPADINPRKKMFLYKEIEYEQFPSLDKKILNIVNLLKFYLKSIGNEEAANSNLVSNFVLLMMRDSCTMDVFYFGFSKYLTLIDNEEENNAAVDKMFLFDKLVKDISQIASYCSERDLAAGIGYFMDVLNWDVREKTKDLESISFYSIKKNMLDICKEDILGNVYFPIYMLYEIAKREKDLYKKEKYFDYCLNMLEANEKNKNSKRKKKKEIQEVESISKKTNHSYCLQVKASIYLELMHCYDENDESEQFYICLDNLRELLTDLSEVDVSELSFSLSCKNHQHIIKEIEKSMAYFDCQKLDDLDALSAERLMRRFMILNTHAFLLESIIKQGDFFQKSRICLDAENLDPSSIEESCIPSKIKTNVLKIIDTLNKTLQAGAISLDVVSKQILEVKMMITPLKHKINDSLNIVKKPYYAAIKQYILDLVPENFSQDFIYEEHSKNNNISFLLKPCRDISKLMHKHEKILSFNAGVLTLNVNNMGVRLDAIINIVNKIYLIKKRLKEQQSIMRNQKSSIPKQFSDFSLHEPVPTSESHIEQIKQPEAEDALLMECKNEKASMRQMRSKTIHSKHQRSKKQGRHLKINDVMEVTKVNTNKLLMAKAIRYLEPENNKDLDVLTAAKNYTLGFILNSNMKKNIIVAVNKRLIDQNGTNISKEAQRKINQITESLVFVSNFGQDGIKRYNQKYGLKIRHAGGKSYRAAPTAVQSVDNDLMLIKYDEVVDKTKMERRKR